MTRFLLEGRHVLHTQVNGVPTAYGELSFAAVSTGPYQTCGVTTDGDAYCWGANWFGVLGDGTTTNRHSPVPVSGGLNFALVSPGCGLATDGRAYCWGRNDEGQLGDGTTTDRLTPAEVSGGLSFATLGTGLAGAHTCGVTTDGDAYCWGRGIQGQLGDGASTNSSTPVPVFGRLKFASVSTGMFYTCGVTTNGSAYCWGGNSDGCLGDGTLDSRTTPVPVSGGLSFTAVSARENHPAR